MTMAVERVGRPSGGPYRQVVRASSMSIFFELHATLFELRTMCRALKLARSHETHGLHMKGCSSPTAKS
jgi:hypothetical protein